MHNQTEKNLHPAKHSVKWSDGKAGLDRALNEAALPWSVQINAMMGLQSSFTFPQLKLSITVPDIKLQFFTRDFTNYTFSRSVVLIYKYDALKIIVEARPASVIMIGKLTRQALYTVLHNS